MRCKFSKGEGYSKYCALCSKHEIVCNGEKKERSKCPFWKGT